MRLVFAGTPDTAVPSLEALLASEHEVVAVLTRPDARAGRGRTLHPSPVKTVALERGIEVLTPVSPRDAAFQQRLREIAPDACPVVAYGALLPAEVLDVPTHGWVNLHFSVLPAWRGAAPVQRAILAGDETTGATTFVIEEGLDTGPVLGLMTETIRPDDTSGTLLDRLAHAGAGLLVATMDGLATGTLTPVPQPAEGVSHAAKLTTADAEIPWTLPAYAVDRHVRGCTPAPGAWTTFRGERLGVEPVVVEPRRPRRPRVPDAEPARHRRHHGPRPGELRATKQAVHVGTGSGPVRLDQVRPPGKKADGRGRLGPRRPHRRGGAPRPRHYADLMPAPDRPRQDRRPDGGGAPGQPAVTAAAQRAVQARRARAAHGLHAAAGRGRRCVREPRAARDPPTAPARRPGRRVRDRAGLRDAADAGVLRRGDRAGRRAADVEGRQRRPRRPAPRRPPAPRHAGSHARRRRPDRRPGPRRSAEPARAASSTP